MTGLSGAVVVVMTSDGSVQSEEAAPLNRKGIALLFV